MKKRIISLCLAITLLLTMLPQTTLIVSANDTDALDHNLGELTTVDADEELRDSAIDNSVEHQTRAVSMLVSGESISGNCDPSLTQTLKGGAIEINETTFPDANFRAYILEQTYGKDGLLTQAELSKVKSLHVNDESIRDLTGIEHFTSLEDLYCYNNQLTSLDMSGCTELEYLDCSRNQLTSLDVSGCVALEDLCCYYNHLTSLDVSGCTALRWLDCSLNNLTSFDVSNHEALEYLYCDSNGRLVSTEQNKYDLRKMAEDGFDAKKASNWQGGIVCGSILTFAANQVTYTYDLGKGKTETFTLVGIENVTDADFPNNPPADVDTVAEKVDWIAQKCREQGFTDEWEIACWLHDWLLYNATYDYSYTNYDPDGVLLQGTGVCESYAEAYRLLLNAFSIENRFVGSSEMNHAWNLVKLNGQWCHVDCTFDDNNGQSLNHAYFGMSDEMISRTHTWLRSDYPAAVSDENYYQVYMSAKGHDWNDATCTAPKTCASCGVTEGTTIPHVYDQEVVDAKYLVSEGIYYKSCKCGEAGTETFTVSVQKPGEFKDVPANAYYHDAVMWAVENGITTGTGDGTTFEPNAICTRGQVVTFLWRAAGKPEPTTTTNLFVDVKSSDYFYKAVLWAKENNITSGTGDGTTFEPNSICNRAQIVTFLSRAKNGQPTSSENPFVDVPVGSYYYNPVLWAVENKITTGTGDGTTFEPNSDCTRGQVITFLWRAYTK